MSPTPDSPEAWRALHRRAEGQLPSNFADCVLLALRTPAAVRANPVGQFLFAVGVAAACLLLVVLVHNHNLEATNQVALASWRQISAQADLFASMP